MARITNWGFCTLLCVFVGSYTAQASINVNEFLSDFGFNGNPFESVPVMEKRMKKIVNSGAKKLLPYVMTTVTEIQLSPNCTQGFLKLIRGILDIRDWAFKMIDALGKPSAGILEGTATALGDYDECLEISAPKNSRNPLPPPYSPQDEAFHGLYCMIQIHLPEALRQAAIQYQLGNRSHSVLANSKTFLRSLIKIAPRADIVDFRLGVCIPSSCTPKDLETIVAEVTTMVKLQATVLRCEEKQGFVFPKDQIAILSVLGFIVAVVIAATIYEGVLRHMTEQPAGELVLDDFGIVRQFILSCSAYNNAKRLTNMEEKGDSNIPCIRGMKFISVALYVVVSTYATPHDFHFLKYRSAFHFYKFMDEWWFTIFANASAGVDSLFFITGLQITYKLWKKAEVLPTGKIRLSALKFWGMWIVRLSCAHLLAIALFLLLPFIGSGPIWSDVVIPEVERCKATWWRNMLFINNFWPSNESCLTHTWIISTIMHLLLLAPILYYILSRWARIGILVNLALIVCSSVAIALMTLLYQLPPAPAFYFLSFLNLSTIWDKLFIQAYDHISPFCVGVLLGYYMATASKVRMSKKTLAVGWIAAIICNVTVLCGLYGYRHGEDMEISLAAFYAAVHRFVWSLGIAWIVFACQFGYGGIVNSILSWRIFLPFEKVSNLTYLLHPLILYLHGGQLREKMYMAHLDQAMYATAYIVFTVALSALCYICFFSPFLFLEKKIWRTNYGPPKNANCIFSSSKPVGTAHIIGLSINCSFDKVERQPEPPQKKKEPTA